MENYCKNHPNRRALSFCHSCGEYFCEKCLNEGTQFYFCNQQNCLNEFIEEGGGPKIEKQSQGAKIGAAIFGILITVLVITVGKEAANILFESEKELNVELSDWRRVDIPNSGFSLELPFSLSSGELSLPEEYEKMIDEMSVYQYTSDPLSLNISYVVYADFVTPNLDGAANGAINNMRIVDGVKNFSSKVTNISLEKIPGRMISGNYSLKNQKVEFKGLIYSEGLKTIQILCLYIENEINRNAVSKIVYSIKKVK
ncbi:MAG: hypothetical protein SCALA702_00220 [Melioribacteraceae bacterium]|nr:MAG: hypothetical protein SCALA702_00220 [Melioribacteraceae bacterium]